MTLPDSFEIPRIPCQTVLNFSALYSPLECLNVDDGSWSCVKVLYSSCDSVLSAKWLIQIGTQVLEWSRLSPNFVHVQGDFFLTGTPLNLLSVGR